MVRSSDALRRLLWRQRAFDIDPPTSPKPIMRRARCPTAERTMDPVRIVAESLTSRPGIREQHRSRRASKWIGFDSPRYSVDPQRADRIAHRRVRSASCQSAGVSSCASFSISSSARYNGRNATHWQRHQGACSFGRHHPKPPGVELANISASNLSLEG